MQITDKTIQGIVAGVLKYGVRSVLAIGLVGGVIFLSNHYNERVDYSQFKENDQSIFQVINKIIAGSLQLDGRSVIYLGIIVLFFTPFLRLLLSLFSFMLEKDKLYVGITLLVLFIIGLSVYFGFGH